MKDSSNLHHVGGNNITLRAEQDKNLAWNPIKTVQQAAKLFEWLVNGSIFN